MPSPAALSRRARARRSCIATRWARSDHVASSERVIGRRFGGLRPSRLYRPCGNCSKFRVATGADLGGANANSCLRLGCGDAAVASFAEHFEIVLMVDAVEGAMEAHCRDDVVHLDGWQVRPARGRLTSRVDAPTVATGETERVAVQAVRLVTAVGVAATGELEDFCPAEGEPAGDDEPVVAVPPFKAGIRAPLSPSRRQGLAAAQATFARLAQLRTDLGVRLQT